MRLSEDNNNKYLKFDATKSMSYQEQNNLNLLQHIIIKHVQACAPGMLPNSTNVILFCKKEEKYDYTFYLIGSGSLLAGWIRIRFILKVGSGSRSTTPGSGSRSAPPGSATPLGRTVYRKACGHYLYISNFFTAKQGQTYRRSEQNKASKKK